jgi:hypothetical protein
MCADQTGAIEKGHALLSIPADFLLSQQAVKRKKRTKKKQE